MITLLGLIAILAGIVVAYRKLSFRKFSALVLALVASLVVTYKIYERNFMLSVVPDALGATTIAYSSEESWGFGPGGNEAGIRVFPLPETTAAEASERGIDFFNRLPPNKDQHDRRWRGRYENWLETPVRADAHWPQNDKSATMNIYDYICRYGFCIDIEPSIAEEATAIVNSPGSYYAYGRIGIIVVSPARRRVLYMYNG